MPRARLLAGADALDGPPPGEVLDVRDRRAIIVELTGESRRAGPFHLLPDILLGLCARTRLGFLGDPVRQPANALLRLPAALLIGRSGPGLQFFAQLRDLGGVGS